MSYTPPIQHPRTAEEIVRLFDGMVFDRQDIHSRLKADDAIGERDELVFTAAGKRELEKSNAVNRIFRLWYQLTWLKDEFSEHFSGATFRQEHGVGDSDIANGLAMFSVATERVTISPYYTENVSGGDDCRIVGRYFSSEALAAAGGAFSYGLAELATAGRPVVAPNFDPEFPAYAGLLQNIKQEAESLPSYALGGCSEEIVYWRLAFEQTGMTLARELNTEGTEENVIRLAQVFTQLLMGLAGTQKDGERDYISVDETIGYLWQVLSEYDGRLMPYETVLESMDEDLELTEQVKDEDLAYSISTFLRLGFLLDRSFLLPADRYFNAVEVVWQDKMTFMTNLATFIQLCNNGLRPTEMPVRDRSDQILLDLANTVSAQDPQALWCNPPTCFRFYDWALEVV